METVSNQSPRVLREKIQDAASKVEFVKGILDKNSTETDWGVGIECKTTATELRKLLAENQVPEEYKVAVVGRFKAGKSAFVNELLDMRLAGEDTSPETAAVTTFRHGTDVKATIHFVEKSVWDGLKQLYENDSNDLDAHRIRNWRRFEEKSGGANLHQETNLFDVDALEKELIRPGGHAIEIALEGGDSGKQLKKQQAAFRQQVKQYTSGSKPHHCLVESIEISAPSPILEEGILLIDTPGLDDTERFRVDLTEKAVEHVDAVLFLTKSGASYGQSEKDFLLSLLRKGTVKQLLFVITQVDHTYDQHRKQARDEDEDPDTLDERIAFEKARIAREIDSTLTSLGESSDSPAMLRYREQLGNVDIVFTSAANHRDWKMKEPVRYALVEGDPGGILFVYQTLLRILSTQSRLALIARNIEAGARSLLDELTRIIDRRLEAMRKEPNREVAERKLRNFLEKFGDVGGEFSKTTLGDAEILKDALTSRQSYADAMIQLIAAQAGDVLREFEAADAGKHWRTRRSGYWGYMYSLQSRVANRIFPKVAELLNTQTDEFVGYIDKFKSHLRSLSSQSSEIAVSLDLGADIELKVDDRLSSFLEGLLSEVQELLESEQSRIVGLLDEFVDEEVEQRISEARRQVANIWGTGTTNYQTSEVRRFYAEVKQILEDALTDHVQVRFNEFNEHLNTQALQLPKRAISEATAEIALVRKEIRAAAESAIEGRKEALEATSSEVGAAVASTTIALDELSSLFDPAGAGDRTEPDSSAGNVGDSSGGNEGTESSEIPAGRSLSAKILEVDVVEDFDPLRSAAITLIRRHVLRRGDTGWTFEKLIDSRLVEGSTSMLITDPYLLRHWQIRNLTELIDSVLKSANLRRIFISTGLNDDPKSPGNDDAFNELAKQLHKNAGVHLDWKRDASLHDRYVVLNNGNLIKLGRGLDIFEPASGLAVTDQSLRQVKECEIDAFGPKR